MDRKSFDDQYFNEAVRALSRVENRVAERNGQRQRMQLNKSLKPCPFCGGKALIVDECRYRDLYDDGCYVTYVRCSNCFARTNGVICGPYAARYCRDEIAASDWNRRKEN